MSTLKVNACQARVGWHWYRDSFRFHKKHFWFSLALFFFQLSPTLFLGAIPFIGQMIAVVISTLTNVGYLTALEDLRVDQKFKSDRLWIAFSDREIRKRLMPWMVLNLSLTTGMAILLWSISVFEKARIEAVVELLPVLIPYVFLLLVYFAFEMTFYFLAMPLIVFKKTGVRETALLSFEAMSKNVKPFLVHGLVGILLSVVLTLLAVLIALPSVFVFSSGMNSGASFIAILFAALFTGFGGLILLAAVMVGLFPSLMVMPYIVYRSVFEEESLN